MNEKLGGILPAALTPLKSDETLDAAALEKLLERVYAGGVDGVYMCGSTGEGMLLPASERKKAAEVAVRCSPKGKQVIVHIGAASEQQAIDLAKHASSLGVAAVSSLPQTYVSWPELLGYYQRLAAAVEVPVVAYYFPAQGGPALNVDHLLEICQIPNVKGVKFTSFDLYTLSLVIRAGNTVFNGHDEVLAAGLLMGASGGIGSFYNLTPSWFVDVFRLSREGKWAEARAVQDRINDLIRTVLAYPMLSALKLALAWSGIDCGHCVKPRRPLTADEETRLRGQLRAMNLPVEL